MKDEDLKMKDEDLKMKGCDGGKVGRNWSYTIPDGPHKGETLWSGRYCCIAAFIFARIDGAWSVLANQRGPGAEDNQGLWNAPCGFLECGETGKEGIMREVFEETTVKVNERKIHVDSIQTTPYVNVTIRFRALLNSKKDNLDISENDINKLGGEKDEVSQVKWVPLKELKDYDWAFDHYKIIRRIWKKIPWWKKLWNI